MAYKLEEFELSDDELKIAYCLIERLEERVSTMIGKELGDTDVFYFPIASGQEDGNDTDLYAGQVYAINPDNFIEFYVNTELNGEKIVSYDLTGCSLIINGVVIADANLFIEPQKITQL